MDPPGTDRPLLPFTGPLHRGVLRRRYKRFFADVELFEHGPVTAHTPNTGAMTGLLDPGNPVLVTHHPDPKRRLPWSLEAIHIGSTWVGTNTYLANRFVRRALETGAVPDLEGYAVIAPETPFPDGGRVDFHLSGHPDRADAWVEVKSVTLREGDVATWPDAVSERGHRHLAALVRRLARGERAVLLFLVQRTDAAAFAPAASVDPAYALALEAAFERGLEIVPLEAAVDDGPLPGLTLGRRLPFELLPPPRARA